jgi:ethanolamine ammonia-lyase large subunit
LPDAIARRAVIHIIGERPGTMHHTFSAYITAPSVGVWSKAGIDHNITRVVSGIADTALKPHSAAYETVNIINRLWKE